MINHLLFSWLWNTTYLFRQRGFIQLFQSYWKNVEKRENFWSTVSDLVKTKQELKISQFPPILLI